MPGWAVGANGTILATADGGVTWTRQGSSTPFDLHGVRFADSMRGWAIGANGTLLVTGDGGATWQARDTGGASPYLSLSAADPLNLWATGGDGSVLKIAVPDVSAIAAAEHLPDMRAALRSSNLGEDTIGQPLADFGSADADLTERTAGTVRSPPVVTAPLVTAQAPSPVPPVPPSTRNLASAASPVAAPDDETSAAALLHDPMVLTSINRIGITAFVLLAGLILGSVIRRAMRLTTHVDACADALTLTGGSANDRFIELVRTLSPSGEVPPGLAGDLEASVSPSRRL